MSCLAGSLRTQNRGWGELCCFWKRSRPSSLSLFNSELMGRGTHITELRSQITSTSFTWIIFFSMGSHTPRHFRPTQETQTQWWFWRNRRGTMRSSRGPFLVYNFNLLKFCFHSMPLDRFQFKVTSDEGVLSTSDILSHFILIKKWKGLFIFGVHSVFCDDASLIGHHVHLSVEHIKHFLCLTKCGTTGSQPSAYSSSSSSLTD
jgi:hypothetical protein